MGFRIYLGSLPGNLTAVDLHKYFSTLVKVKKITLGKSTKKLHSLGNSGYAFLTVDTKPELERLKSQDHIIGGRKIKCEDFINGLKLSEKKNELENRRLFLANISSEVSDEMLESYFSRYGAVESAYKVKVQSTNKSCGFGYLTFVEADSAAKLRALGSVQIQGVHIVIAPYVKKSVTGSTRAEPHAYQNPNFRKPKCFYQGEAFEDFPRGDLKGNPIAKSQKPITSEAPLLATASNQSEEHRILPNSKKEKNEAEEPHFQNKPHKHQINTATSESAISSQFARGLIQRHEPQDRSAEKHFGSEICNGVQSRIRSCPWSQFHPQNEPDRVLAEPGVNRSPEHYEQGSRAKLSHISFHSSEDLPRNSSAYVRRLVPANRLDAVLRKTSAACYDHSTENLRFNSSQTQGITRLEKRNALPTNMNFF